MASREELKEIKNYLTKELSKNYDPIPGHAVLTLFEPHKNIRIEESRHAGDITRNVYYATEDLSSYVGYVSFFKKRDPKYAVCIANSEGIIPCKKASVAANKFASNSKEKIEDIIWEHEHTPKKEKTKFHPELFKNLHDEIQKP